jgi:hypothetical protein
MHPRQEDIPKEEMFFNLLFIFFRKQESAQNLTGKEIDYSHL